MFPTCDRPNTSKASFFSPFGVTGWGIKFHLIQNHAGDSLEPPAARENLRGKWSRTTKPTKERWLYAEEIRGEVGRLARPGLAWDAMRGLGSLLGLGTAEQAGHRTTDRFRARWGPVSGGVGCRWPYPTGWCLRL